MKSFDTLRDRLVRHLANSPALYRLLCHVSPEKRRVRHHLCFKGSDLVLEGFPRCGNTFSRHAFLLAQEDRSLQVATHHHSQAQIHLAARYGIPACVLIRPPEAAVRSLLVRNPSLRPARALAKYQEFYTDLLPLHPHFVTATFDEVTTNFGAVIEQINERFSTHFTPFTHDRQHTERVFQRIESVNQQLHNSERAAIARPDPAKQPLNAAVNLSAYRAELTQAQGVYDRFIATTRPDLRRS